MECVEMQNQSCSSKISHSASSRVTTALHDSMEKTASPTSNCRYLPPAIIPTSGASGSSASMRPEKVSSGFPRSITVTLNDVLRFFHVENFSNASEEEAIFFFRLHFLVHARAKVLARESKGVCDRAYAAIMVALGES